ncbi:MAG TPA: FAD-binding protein, partial [Candidatus Korarchaeota archaeon]|nr:FAD-binding protein [Candidatus Korarchaeota archaeon]
MNGLRRTDILVVGGGIAGISAAIAAKAADRRKDVILVGEEPFPYRRPSIFSLIEGGSFEDLAIFGRSQALEQGIRSFFNSKIEILDLEDRSAKLE